MPGPSPLAVEFQERGFVTVPGLVPPDAVETYVGHLERLSARRRVDVAADGRARGAWSVPDGVTRHAEFWPVIFDERLLATVRELLGPDARFLQHTDLHVGFSSFNWHRDSVSRRPGVGADWDERDEPYRIVRVGLYLHAAGEFRLGLVPGTHRLHGARRRHVERQAGWLGHAVRAVTGRNPRVDGAVWVAASAGDAVIFDPRVLHTGTPVDGPKYSVFVAYGVPSRHFHNHRNYYRHIRRELGYGDLPPELVARLQAAGLYHEVPPPVRVEGATTPSGIERLFARTRRAAGRG